MVEQEFFIVSGLTKQVADASGAIVMDAGRKIWYFEAGENSPGGVAYNWRDANKFDEAPDLDALGDELGNWRRRLQPGSETVWHVHIKPMTVHRGDGG